MRASIVTAVLLFVSLISSHAQIPNDVPQQLGQASDFGWHRFSPPDNSFSVELPSPPEHEHEPVLTDNPYVGESYTAVGASDAALSFYIVDFYCSKGSRANDLKTAALLQEELMAGARPSKNAAGRPILVDGFPGRESIQNKRGSYLRGRSVVAGPRTYILSFVSHSAADSATLGTRFFNSFHVNRSAGGSLPDCPSIEGRLPVATVGNIHLVSFPEDWMANTQGQSNRLLSARWYEVRSSGTATNNELFFGTLAYRNSQAVKQNEEWYGRNFYAVRLSPAVQLRRLTRTEWRHASPISDQAVELSPELADDIESRTVKYQGREYAKTAEHLGRALLSPSGHWIAVFSFSGQVRPGNLFMSGLPREGDIYWDVYDTRSGERVLAWSARMVLSPALLAEAALWIDDKYLVMPFGGILQSCVIGELPRN